MPLNASLAELLNSTIETVKEDIHTAIPSRVIRCNMSAQTVDVEPAVKAPYTDEDGEIAFDTLPNVLGVPLCFPRGGGYFISVPIQPGDFVWLMTTSVDIARWRSIGGTAVEPEFSGKHGLNSTFAIPGAFPESSKLADAHATNLRVGRDGAEPQIMITPTEILLGKTATEFVALANLVQSALNEIRKQFNDHSHATAPPGPVSTPTPVIGALGPVAATIVKAK